MHSLDRAVRLKARWSAQSRVSCRAVGAASTAPTGGFAACAGSSSPAELVLLVGPPWAPGQAQGSGPGSGLWARPSSPFELALVARAWGDLEPLQAFVLKNPSFLRRFKILSYSSHCPWISWLQLVWTSVQLSKEPKLGCSLQNTECCCPVCGSVQPFLGRARRDSLLLSAIFCCRRRG